MGFDVYGMNPRINKSKEEFKTLYKYDVTIGESEEGKENWSLKWNKLDSASKRTKDAYWKQHGDFEASNPGVYFRNNVWWWRPLWDYIYNATDLISEKEWNDGHMNDGLEIDEDRAKKIAEYLDYALRSGEVKDYEKEYRNMSESNENPYDYPFSEENVREFAMFCHESGGFQIC